MASEETKQDVFDDALAYAPVGREYDPVNDDEAGDLRSCLSARYAAALPDDLPVIPKAVSEWIKECKHNNTTLANALCMEMRPEAVRWWMEFKDGDIANRFDYAGYPRKQEIMAKAWVLGVWRIEETGEIVKL